MHPSLRCPPRKMHRHSEVVASCVRALSSNKTTSIDRWATDGFKKNNACPSTSLEPWATKKASQRRTKSLLRPHPHIFSKNQTERHAGIKSHVVWIQSSPPPLPPRTSTPPCRTQAARQSNFRAHRTVGFQTPFPRLRYAWRCPDVAWKQICNVTSRSLVGKRLPLRNEPQHQSWVVVAVEWPGRDKIYPGRPNGLAEPAVGIVAQMIFSVLLCSLALKPTQTSTNSSASLGPLALSTCASRTMRAHTDPRCCVGNCLRLHSNEFPREHTVTRSGLKLAESADVAQKEDWDCSPCAAQTEPRTRRSRIVGPKSLLTDRSQPKRPRSNRNALTTKLYHMAKHLVFFLVQVWDILEETVFHHSAVHRVFPADQPVWRLRRGLGAQRHAVVKLRRHGSLLPPPHRGVVRPMRRSAILERIADETLRANAFVTLATFRPPRPFLKLRSHVLGGDHGSGVPSFKSASRCCPRIDCMNSGQQQGE